jgi:hypothetical protein
LKNRRPWWQQRLLRLLQHHFRRHHVGEVRPVKDDLPLIMLDDDFERKRLLLGADYAV